MAHSTVGSLSSASVTLLCAPGGGSIIAAGLCGRLRAFAPTADEADAWALVADEECRVPLARGRTSTFPYRHVTPCTAAGRFVVATSQPNAPLQVWCSRNWAKLQELMPTARDERWSPSVLELSARYLACGSREGQVALWTLDDVSAEPFMQCWDGRSMRADEGPIAALFLDDGPAAAAGGVLVAAYRQADGSVDGVAFYGEQSVAGWSLSSGALLWRLPQRAGVPPTLGLFGWHRRLWLLHAHSAQVDAAWPWLRPAGASSAADVGPSPAGGAVLAACSPPLTELPALAAATADGRLKLPARGEQPQQGQAESQARWVLGEGRRVLCWDTGTVRSGSGSGSGSSSGSGSGSGSLALGFAGGLVGLLLLEGPDEGAAGEAERDGVVGQSVQGSCSDTSDVGSVLLLSRAPLATEASRSPPMVVSGSASGIVRLWQARWRAAASPVAPGVPGRGSVDVTVATKSRASGIWAALELAMEIQLPLQPCSLARYDGGVACGGADGQILALPLSKTTLLAAIGAQPSTGAERTKAIAPEGGAKGGGAPGGGAGDDGAGDGGVAKEGAEVVTVAQEYVWRFIRAERGGSAAGGLVADRRDMFNGWARTADYERGLVCSTRPSIISDTTPRTMQHAPPTTHHAPRNHHTLVAQVDLLRGNTAAAQSSAVLAAQPSTTAGPTVASPAAAGGDASGDAAIGAGDGEGGRGSNRRRPHVQVVSSPLTQLRQLAWRASSVRACMNACVRAQLACTHASLLVRELCASCAYPCLFMSMRTCACICRCVRRLAGQAVRGSCHLQSWRHARGSCALLRCAPWFELQPPPIAPCLLPGVAVVIIAVAVVIVVVVAAAAAAVVVAVVAVVVRLAHSLSRARARSQHVTHSFTLSSVWSHSPISSRIAIVCTVVE